MASPSHSCLSSSYRERLIAALEDECSPTKAMPATSGWLFLINDSNDFLRWQFGLAGWSLNEKSRAIGTLRERERYLESRGIAYYKFAIPEKSVIYSEYLPEPLNIISPVSRPATILDDEVASFSYPLGELNSLKGFGLSYFRGDSHPNWLGSYHLYRHIHRRISADFPEIGDPIQYADLLPVVAAYDGDLYSQLNGRLHAGFDVIADHARTPGGLELLIKLDVHPSKKVAQPAEPSFHYKSAFQRPTFRYRRSDKKLPRCLIVRDSTSQFMIEFLAHHFSESLFYWHGGHVYQDIIDLEKPDIVLHIMAERFLGMYSKFHVVSNIADFVQVDANVRKGLDESAPIGPGEGVRRQFQFFGAPGLAAPKGHTGRPV